MNSFFFLKCIIFTNCKNCIEKSDLSKRSSRWKLLLEPFNYTLKHIDSRKNTFADSISWLSILSTKEIKHHQSTIDFRKINALHKKYSYNDIKDYKKEIIRDGLEWSTDNRGKIFIHSEIADEVVKIMHENLIHPGINKMFTEAKNISK